MVDQLGVLKLVAARLNAARIAHMVTGSIALGYYAQPRMTRDIDLVVDLASADAHRLARLFRPEFGTNEDSICRAIDCRSMFKLIHEMAAVKVDFVVRKADAFRVEEFSRRRPVTLDGQEMWMVSAEDLILSKLVWSKESESELQRRDVRQLIRHVDGLDWPYIDRWATTLSVADTLETLRR
jgi:hypothetical protein